MSSALVSNIQRFSLDDGPGIRTTVFFKGCNLKCVWCHNPECINPNIRLQYNPKQCTLCGKCVNACKQEVHKIIDGKHVVNFSNCIACGKCKDVCLNDALELNGTYYSADALLKEIQKDFSFYQDSSGGVTFSGGEPMLQLSFLKELLPLCKRTGLTVAVDTAGNIPFSDYEQILPYVDYFLYDIKAFTESVHRKYTGVSNQRILENIKHLTNQECTLIVRVPVIPGVNDNEVEMNQISDFLKRVQPQLVQLLPFHNYGVKKYRLYGLNDTPFQPQPPKPEYMDDLLSLFQSKGINTSF